MKKTLGTERSAGEEKRCSLCNCFSPLSPFVWIQRHRFLTAVSVAIHCVVVTQCWHLLLILNLHPSFSHLYLYCNERITLSCYSILFFRRIQETEDGTGTESSAVKQRTSSSTELSFEPLFEPRVWFRIQFFFRDSYDVSPNPCPEKTPHDLYSRTTAGVGDSLREKSLPWHLL